MNRIMLIGNLTRDPEAMSTAGGVNFTRFTIAVNRPFTNADGERVADFFDIIAWRQLGDRCARYLNKSNKVGIVGSVQRRQFEDKDGVRHTMFDVVADEVEFLSPKSADSAPKPQGESVSPRIDGKTGQMSLAPDADMTPVDGDALPF